MPGTSAEALKNRIAARAHLARPGQPPIIFVIFGESCDMRRARIGDLVLLREKDESFEDFEDRVRKLMPVNGAAIAFMSLNDNEA